MTAITDKKLRDKIMKTNSGDEEDNRPNQTKHIRKEKQKEYNTRSSNIDERKTHNKRRADTKKGKIRNKTEKHFGNRPCRFCSAPNWTPLQKCPATDANCNKCGKKGHYAKACRQKFNNNRTVKRLTEDEMNEPNESSCESEESIHHIKEIKKIEETNKHYIANVKIKGIMKEFKIDTGSPISIMPPDKRILKPTHTKMLTRMK